MSRFAYLISAPFPFFVFNTPIFREVRCTSWSSMNDMFGTACDRRLLSRRWEQRRFFGREPENEGFLWDYKGSERSKIPFRISHLVTKWKKFPQSFLGWSFKRPKQRVSVCERAQECRLNQRRFVTAGLCHSWLLLPEVLLMFVFASVLKWTLSNQPRLWTCPSTGAWMWSGWKTCFGM